MSADVGMTLAELSGALAAFSGRLFCGAACYISLVEHPARMECGTALAATEFPSSYRRAAKMQVSLALCSTLAAVTAAAAGASLLWLLGGAFIFAVIPFTFLMMMPINRQLRSSALNKDAASTYVLLDHWGKLHGMRAAMSVLACLVYFVLLILQA